jgi:hypothetical protein
MAKEDDDHFVKVELANALRAIYARAITKPALASKLLFDRFRYAGRDATRESSHADILKALAFCFKLVNTNAHDDPAAARRILKELESIK